MTEQLQKIIRKRTEDLATLVADILSDPDCDQHAELAKAYENFDNELVDDIVPAARNHHASQVADLLVESGAGMDGVPFTRATALYYLLRNHNGAAMLRRLGKSEDTNVTTNFESITKAVNRAEGEVSNLSQAEYVEMGRAQFGKDAFNKMLGDAGSDVFKAASALHAHDIRAWSAKYHGVPPAYTQADVEPELAKMRNKVPHSKIPEGQSGWSNVSIEPENDLEQLIRNELRSAPWLSWEEAEARVREAVRAAERVATRRRNANRGALPKV
jgi:hypothetical protein